MSKAEIIHKIESFIPNNVLKVYRKSKHYWSWKMQQIAYRKALRKVRAKQGPLNVVFIVHESAIWKYDSLYRLLKNDEMFNPIVLVCPIIHTQTRDMAQSVLERTYDTFVARGYQVIKAAEDVTSHGINIDSLNPDVVFYSYLWTSIIEKQYNTQHLRKYLKCYVNYAYITVPGEWSFASAFHGLMWRYFCECESNRQLCLSYNKREFSKNIRVVGYPIFDEYQDAKGDPIDWKDSNPKFKRIIWAPHHTIEGHDGLLQFSTFLEIADSMVSIAEQYKDTLQFAFKPHPALKPVLYNHPKWGKERTDAYYNSWRDGDNTVFVAGPYIELFKSSDAMIHDCGSFIVEYLYSQKPVLYLGNSRVEQSNNVGKKAYQCHYHGTTITDVRHFLEDVVLSENDSMKSKRETFYKEALLPPNDRSVAENIMEELKKELCK